MPKSRQDLRSVVDVESATEELGFRVDAFLRARGWKYTCDTPGSYWLWQKPLSDGRVVLVSKDTALSFERATSAGEEDVS